MRGADGALGAALFITRQGTLPPRDWIAAQLGATASAQEWLAARPSAPAPDRGPVVCVCHGIGERAIEAAVREGACDLTALGKATKAGTNCGSCRPSLARLMAQMMEMAP